jgi:hypothetical protein
MNFYEGAFLLLVSICGLLTWRQYHNGEESTEKKSLTRDAVTPRAKAEGSKFTRLFLTVYCLVMGSDWLQGMAPVALPNRSFQIVQMLLMICGQIHDLGILFPSPSFSDLLQVPTFIRFITTSSDFQRE